jgi:hypothetical protein
MTLVNSALPPDQPPAVQPVFPVRRLFRPSRREHWQRQTLQDSTLALRPAVGCLERWLDLNA